MTIRALLFGALCLFICATQAHADTLYGATAAGGVAGELYILDPATGGMLQDIGPLIDSGNVNYGITGLAFSPTTGILYGSTANGNGNAATVARLVTINPATGLVTVIGSFNAGPVNAGGAPATMGDIAFDSAGNLWGIGTVGGPDLYSINIITGQATLVGANGVATSTNGGGLAISAAGVFDATPTASRFGTYNSSTGAFTNIANPTKPVGGDYAALDFNSSGVLYGLNLGPNVPPAATHLVIINPANAAVTDIGASVINLDAIAFQIPEPGSCALILISGCALLLARLRRTGS